MKAMCVYLRNLQRCGGRLQRGAGRWAGYVLSRFLVELELCQLGLLLLPEQMQPLLLLQLPLPLQLMLFLTVVVVKHLSPGSEINVLLPQDVDQVHVLEGVRISLGSCEQPPRCPAGAA